jgi:uncharacterized protein (TIGR03437 family)
LFFTVDTTSLPYWLTVDYVTGTTPKSIRFTSTTAADLMAPGTYSQAVLLKVSGQSDYPVTMTIQINSPAPTLTVKTATPIITWVIGDPIPTATINLVSSGGTIPYAITGSGTLVPTISKALATGLAYNFGTQIPVTFDQSAFASAQANTQLNGVLSVVWGSPAVTTVVTFTVNVQSPFATLSSIFPASVAAATAPASYTLTLTGTGFIKSPDTSIATHVGISNSGAYIENTNLAVNVTDSSHISLTITVPAVATALLPFNTITSAQVILSVCNPVGGVCNTVNPGSISAFTIGSVPTITTITSASAFIQPTNVAPYDIISIFGYNFCPTCSTAQVMTGTLDPRALVYPTSLSDGNTPPKTLAVTFQKSAGATGTLALTPANLLFATDNQINLLVPSGVSNITAGTADIVVTAGGMSSQAFAAPVAASDPGIFTIGSDGKGSGAILANADYSLITLANPAAVKSDSQGASDVVQIYMSGLGVPWAGVDNAATSATGLWPAECLAASSYVTLLNNATGGSATTVDGAVIQSSLMNPNRLPPCLNSTGTVPTVTVGGVNAPVSYAGWVADSVAGLYQIDATLPPANAAFKVNPSDNSNAAVTQPIALPVVVTLTVTAGGATTTSQAGVTMAIVKRLVMAAPSPLVGTIGVAWNSTNVVATKGTSPYIYKLVAGQLPLGLKFASDGSLSGTPAIYTSGTYNLTVTATDSASVTGTVSFTLTIDGGLAMSSSVTAPAAVWGTAQAALTVVTATGGVSPYTYSITGPANLPASKITISSLDSGVTGTVAISADTDAGTYNVVVHAVDSTGTQALTGDISIPVVVSLNLPVPARTSQVTGTSSGLLATVQAAGGHSGGTITYTLDGASLRAGLLIGANTGAITVGNAQPMNNWDVIVTATDSTGALGSSAVGTATQTFQVTVSPITTLTLATTSTTTITYTTGGSITLAAQGGTAPYTYTITGPASGSSFADSHTGTLTVPAGTQGSSFSITVTVTDANLVVKNLTFTVTYTTAVVVTATLLNPYDHTAESTIAITATGGTPGYTYSISGSPYNCWLVGNVLHVPAGATGTSFSIIINVLDSQSVLGTNTFTIHYD